MTHEESARASLRVQTTGVSGLERACAGLFPGAVPQYRLPLGSVRRTADFAWPEQQVALFVDGCFWHGHGCRPRPVRANAEYWAVKIVRNRQRDKETDALLAEAGWRSVRLWECDLRGRRLRDELWGPQDDQDGP